MSGHSKTQRWTDLIAALLARRIPITFDELVDEVPAYATALASNPKESVKRTFERDKDELRDFGIRIVEAEGRYRLRPADFYLPYLALEDAGQPRAARPQPEGYRTLPHLQFSPDELLPIVSALARLESLGDPRLSDDARSVHGKLLFDLPFQDHAPVDVTILGANDGASRETFDALSQALRRRKTVTFQYHAPTSAAPAERRVDPYGLFFVHAHWYLAAFDHDREGLRNFRLSRMTDVVMNTQKKQTPDFTVPSDFQLMEHARSRAAWDLGEAESLDAHVRFTGGSGAVRAAAMLGVADESDDSVRRFPVARADVFARWLLSFGGDAQPLSPPSLVATYQQLVRDTLARYGASA